MIPSPSSGWPNFAVSEAMRRSHASASSQPPPSAYPLIAAIVGRGKRSISAKSDELIAASPSSRPRSRLSLMSAPETNADSPPPVMITTPPALSAASVSRAARIAPTVSRSRAFLTSGRSMVIVAIDSAISVRTLLVVIDSASDFSAETAGLDVLRQQRTRAVLLPHAAVQVFEDAEPRVEADEIDKLEGAHRMIQPELQRLVDVARRGHAFHQHEERLVANARVDPRGDEARRLADQHGLFPHAAGHGFDRLERGRCALECLDDLDQLHAMHRVEEVHPGHARGVAQRPGHLGDAEGGGVRRDDCGRRGQLLDLLKEGELQGDLLGRRFDDEVAPGQGVGEARRCGEPAEDRIRIRGGGLAELVPFSHPRVDRGAALLDRSVADVVHPRRVSAGDRRMRDPMPHRPRANYGYVPDLHALSVTISPSVAIA